MENGSREANCDCFRERGNGLSAVKIAVSPTMLEEKEVDSLRVMKITIEEYVFVL